jgi:cellobiose phosphorylase
MYRLVIEGLLGLTRSGDQLCFEPHLNPTWDSCQCNYVYGETCYQLDFRRGATGNGVRRILHDNAELPTNFITLVDDKQVHCATIETH